MIEPDLSLTKNCHTDYTLHTLQLLATGAICFTSTFLFYTPQSWKSVEEKKEACY